VKSHLLANEVILLLSLMEQSRLRGGAYTCI